MNRDQYGIIVQADSDDGDSLHRQCVSVIGNLLAGGIETACEEYLRAIRLSSFDESGHIYWQRGKTKWTDPGDTSRDQLIAVIVALGMWEGLCQFPNKHLGATVRDYKFKAPNGDAMFTHLSVMHRALYSIEGRFQRGLRWAFVCVTDLFLLGGAIVKCLPWRYNDQKKALERNGLDQVDDWNDVLPLLQAVYHLPTPVSWLARTIYRCFRGRSHGTSFFTEFSDPYAALRWYNRAESGGNPELLDNYIPELEKWFSTPRTIQIIRQLADRFLRLLRLRK